jgi:hypothetical protein
VRVPELVQCYQREGLLIEDIHDPDLVIAPMHAEHIGPTEVG